MRKKKADAAPVVYDAEYLAGRICSAVRGKQEEHFCFILGAGASVESGIPTGDTLEYKWMQGLMKNQARAKHLAAELQKGGKMTHSFEEIVSHWEERKAAKEATLDSKYYFDIYALREAVTGEKGQALMKRIVEKGFPCYGYVTLAKLLAHKSGNNLVITTNFDDLVEQALSLYTDATPIVANHEALAAFISNRNCRLPLIAKVHRGKLYDPINSPEDTSGLKGNWEQTLNKVFDYYTPIVIGYGGGDHSLMDYLKSHKLKNGILWCAYGNVPDDPDILAAVRKSYGSFVVHDGFKSLLHIIGKKTFRGKVSPENVNEEVKRRLDQRYEKFHKLVEKSIAESKKGKALDFFRRAYKLAEEGDYKGAIDNYTVGLKFDPSRAVAYNNRGNAYKNNGKYDMAIADYNKAIELDPKYAIAYNNRGIAYDDRGEYDKAIANYTKAIELDPKHTTAYNNRGNAYDDKGEYDKAIADYNKAIELDPKYVKAYNNRGIAYDDKGEYDKAIADYNRAIELDPKYAAAYNSRGNAYNGKGEYDKAIVDYNKAIELDPKYVAAYNNRGIAYNGKGKYDKAIADYNKATELDPKYTKAYNNRGNAYGGKGEYYKAIADYDKAIELDPKYATAYNNRGNTYEKMCKLKEALADYNKALELNPDYKKAKENRERVLARMSEEK